MLPNGFIVGAARCGTTTVYRYLLEHPEAFVPRERKELGWFSNASGRVDDFSLYKRLFEPGRDRPRRLDISPAYLYDEHAPKAIRDACGEDLRIVVFVRNPVDAARSLWQFQVSHGYETLDFSAAIEAEALRKRNPAGLVGWAPNYFYVDRYRYAPQVKRFLDVFGSKRVRIFVFERFFEDLQGGWRDLCEFLEINPTLAPAALGTRHNQSGRLRNAFVGRILASPPTALRRSVRKLMPSGLRWRIASAVEGWNLLPGQNVDLTAGQRTTLRRAFEDDIGELSHLTGTDFRAEWRE